MGWLIALAVLVILGLLPLGVSASYSEAGPLVRLILGPVKLQIYPGRQRKQKSGKKSPAPKKRSVKDKQCGSLSDFLPAVRIILDFLGDLRRKLRVERLEMKLILAEDDPCDLGTHYGQAWAVLGSLEPQLDRLFVIKHRDLQILSDFTESKTKITARLELTLTVGRLLGLTVRYGLRILREFISITKLRKGGAVK